jgi:hypothetical protein
MCSTSLLLVRNFGAKAHTLGKLAMAYRQAHCGWCAICPKKPLPNCKCRASLAKIAKISFEGR